MTDEVRKWEDRPYGPNYSNIVSVFERDLMDDLKAEKGFRQVLWNSPADAKTASWLAKIIYVETDPDLITKESEEKLHEGEYEPESATTVEVTKTSYCVQLTKKFYGHKLRDFGERKIKMWQRIDNVKS